MFHIFCNYVGTRDAPEVLCTPYALKSILQPERALDIHGWRMVYQVLYQLIIEYIVFDYTVFVNSLYTLYVNNCT